MLEKNVAAMVRDIRDGAADAISRNLSEIKMELSSSNPRIKMNAVLKLGYLSMLGYDLSIAQLQIIEMMANPQFVLKRPAMFIAALAFEKNCEENSLVLMTTNLFRKELVSPNYLEVGMALSCLSCVITEDMAESLLSSVLGQVTASRPYIRKKVALSLFKLIEKSPELFIPAFPKLKELVVDGDQSVQSAAVSTFLEIAKRNPKLAIPLIPIFFHLFKETRNNWTLIKMIKLMELLCGVEPRLFGKLIDSKILIHLLDTNKARSVEIEIIRLVTRLIPLETQMESEHIDRVMINLKNLIEASDLNIKCLAIDILVTFLGRHGSAVDMDFFFPVILASLGSTDCTVRQLAMKAIKFLVKTPTACRDVIQQLLTLFTQFEGKPDLQLDFIKGVTAIGRMENFAFISDPEWYLRILVLLGGSDAVVKGRDGRIVLNEIVEQYTAISKQRDPVGSMKISVAALTNPKIALSSALVAACAWTISEYSFVSWQPEHFSLENCKLLLGIFLDHARKVNNDVEARIVCLWSALRFAAAYSFHEQSSDLLSIFQAVMADGKTFAGAPIAVENMVVIAASLVAELLAGRGDSVQDFFRTRMSQNEEKPPSDIDKPMIELPASLKRSSSIISLSTITSLLGEDVYRIIDEDCGKRTYSLIDCESVEKVIEEPDPLSQLFTIKGVLATK